VAQGADARLVMIAQQLDGLVEQLGFVVWPRSGVAPPQPG
jgi:hypothetical protein